MTLETMFSPGTTLSDALHLSMIESVFHKTPYAFLPQGALDLIINEATILGALGITQSTPEDCKLVAYILMQAKRLFATAVCIGLRQDKLYRAMVLFRDSNFSDERLPLESINREDFLENRMGGLEHPLAKLEGHRKHNTKKIWTVTRIHDFLKAQFSFLTPIISATKLDQKFARGTILPFVRKHAAQQEGSFGVVSKYEIHPDHWMPAGQNNISSNTWAVKEIKSFGGNRQEITQRWKSEVNALRTMNKLNQDHIVRFITSFRQDTSEETEHYLVFEWADGGNLHDLWKSIPNPPLTGSFVRAAIKQLSGLARALSAAHGLRSDGAHTCAYRHGDLKPANILWFGSGDTIGTLKIGDWGEAKTHQIGTAERNNNTTAKYGTRRYEPPECETGIVTTFLGQRAMRRSRLYDIWSFGCITLEMIIWLLYGTKGLREFDSSKMEDQFYNINSTRGEKSARVHNVVARWMRHISNELACRAGSTAIGDLLNLVERGLLVTKLPSRGAIVPSNDPILPYDKVTEEGPDFVSPKSSPRPKDSPSQVTVEDIPIINITLADEAEPDKGNSRVMQPESATKEPVRYRADELCYRLELIESRVSEDSYWSIRLELPLPDDTLVHFSIPSTHDDKDQRPRPNGDYGVHTKANIRAHRRSLVKNGNDQPEAYSGDQARNARNVDDSELQFIARGRPKGSKNKRTAQTTGDSTNIPSSTPPSSRSSKPKRPRIDQDDEDNDKREQSDQERSPQRADSRSTLAAGHLACPFAKYRPLEYPQCRIIQYRDNAKIKEHLRERHRRYCARCGEAFHTESVMDEHMRQIKMCTTEPRTLVDGSLTYMSKDKEARISKHAISWSGMYEILFPDAVPQDSSWINSEYEVLILIGQAHGFARMLIPPEVFLLYQQNQCAKSTCSARAALHCNWTATYTQSGAFQTSDSGFHAPEEQLPVLEPSARFIEVADLVPQEKIPSLNTGTYEEQELQEVVDHVMVNEPLDMQTTSGSSNVLDINNSGDKTTIAPSEEQPNDTAEDSSGMLDPTLPSLATFDNPDWLDFEQFTTDP